MAYFMDSRVRFSECGPDGKLTLPGIMDYFQDCCTFQTTDIGQGPKELKARHRFWVLATWHVFVERYPEEGEWIRTTTLPYQLRGFMGLRNMLMENRDGERLAWADSLWIFMDMETYQPARLKAVDIEGYEMCEPLEMEKGKRKIILPEHGTECEPFEIQKHHLDRNHHVNNVEYIRIAEDYLPEDFKVYELRVECKKQGFPGDIFCPVVYENRPTVTVALNNRQGEPYAVIEAVEK